MIDILDSPHGRCAILELPDDATLEAALAKLPTGEQAAAAALTGARRRDFISGRTALHAVFDATIAVLADDRGQPVFPPEWTGSISHKDGRAAAIVAPSPGFVGIDLERAAPSRMDISSRVLTAREPRAEGKQLTRVFAIKEAIYKAVHPIVRRYVGFAEVELVDDVARPVDPAKLPVALDVWCIERDGHWLATARATRL